MKQVATRAGLLCLLLSLMFVACKKNWPGGGGQEGFPPFQSPIKKVTLYSLETGALYATRAYTYDEHLRLETISYTEYSSNLPHITTYRLQYSGQNRLDALVGTDSMNMPPTIYYQYDTAGLKRIVIGTEEMGKIDILRPPYAVNWAETPQYVVQPVTWGHIIFYIDGVNKNITRQAASLGDYWLESEHLYRYSKLVNPEYGVMKKAALMEIGMVFNLFSVAYTGIDVVSPMLPENISQRIYDTPFESGGHFTFDADHHQRVTKTYQEVDGVNKLIRAYEYY
jgi:hypothetical protein